MSHIITQGGPSLPFVPRWMGKNWAKPLTLFYRVAYRMAEVVANSVTDYYNISNLHTNLFSKMSASPRREHDFQTPPLPF